MVPVVKWVVWLWVGCHHKRNIKRTQLFGSVVVYRQVMSPAIIWFHSLQPARRRSKSWDDRFFIQNTNWCSFVWSLCRCIRETHNVFWKRLIGFWGKCTHSSSCFGCLIACRAGAWCNASNQLDTQIKRRAPISGTRRCSFECTFVYINKSTPVFPSY